MRASSAACLLSGTLLAAAGYGATFLFSAYFHAIGGNDIDTGLALGSAMLGTFIGVPLVGWLSGRVDAAAMASAAGGAIACGFMIFGLSNDVESWLPRLAAGLIGLGWGMFYIGAPMGLSERVAKDAFHALGCDGMARVDFFVTSDLRIVVNELNTIPGFTDISMYAKAMAASGVGYAEVIDRLVEHGLARSAGPVSARPV